jgi:Glycosyl transferase 4-like domain
MARESQQRRRDLKRVLVVAPNFSPSSRPPALRMRFFVPHLEVFGWKPTVLTVRRQYNDSIGDSETDELLPACLDVIRTGALPAEITRRIGFSDLGLRTLWSHWRVLSRLCRTEPLDLIFISAPPYYSSVLGRLAWQRYHIPYVLDYQDPWHSSYYYRLSSQSRPGGRKWAAANAVAGVLDPFTLRHAAHVTAVSQGTIDDLRAQYPNLALPSTTEIPLGAEPADFDYLRTHPRRNPVFESNDGLLHVSSVGRGGADLVPALRAVFAAVRLGLDRQPELFGRLRLHFVGTSYARSGHGAAQIVPIANEVGIGHLVDESPDRVPYLDAIQILCDSHALLAVGSELSHYTASKIFPLILARRPILSIFHRDSTVNSILMQTAAGEPITFDANTSPTSCAPQIHARLHALLQLPREAQPPTRWESFERYTGRAMAARFATAFDSACETPGCYRA